MRHTNEYNKLHASSAAVSIRMLGFPILATPGSLSLFCSTSHLLDFTSMFAATVTPHPKTKTQPCKNSCGLWDGEEFCLNSKSLWRHFVYEHNQKMENQILCSSQTEIPNPNLKWRNRYYSTVQCLGSLQRKPAKGSPDSDMYFTSLHFCNVFWT